MKAYSIRIFLPDGVPDGLRIIEKSNWTGLGVVCPRPLLNNAKSRDEFSKTGVYILSGPAESGGLPTVYIGEAESIRPRLESHASNKDFWTSVTFFVSKDDNLNKAHVQYLESRLVGLAKETKRSTLENATEPSLPSLSEADRADVEGFLDEMLLCLPIVGLTVFEKPSAPPIENVQLKLAGPDATATGYESADGFVVLAGSKGRLKETKSFHNYVSRLRETLSEQGVVYAEGKHLILKQDYEFSSPSTAAAVILGRNANGRIEWKDPKGLTLKELQEGKSLTGNT